MTRKEKIDVIVTDLLLGPYTKMQEVATEGMLRRGFRGLNNYTDKEIDEFFETIDKDRIEGLRIAASILAENRVDPEEILKRSIK